MGQCAGLLFDGVISRHNRRGLLLESPTKAKPQVRGCSSQFIDLPVQRLSRGEHAIDCLAGDWLLEPRLDVHDVEVAADDLRMPKERPILLDV